VDPIFFPGGDIGKLAVCGTVNDMAVSGATPRYISASFIIEEGLALKDLEAIAGSMSDEAKRAGVTIVTGDTKVVEKGKCDKLFITTSGVGILRSDLEHISSGKRVKSGDKIIINGPSFSSPVVSDCASLNHLIRIVLDDCHEIHFMRDLTRGGLATVLNELAQIISMGITINESAVPVEEPVKGLCEILGFDPLYLANEGKILFVAGNEEQNKILNLLRAHPFGRHSEVIGEIVHDNRNLVVLNTSIGGRRILDMPSGIQLPRIC
jgi:hydrogenase expression/formation protein HypE